MNKFGFFFGVLLSVLLSLWSQAVDAQVITGNVTLNTQSAVDGMAGVTEVTGNLTIYGSSVINVDSLGSLKKIGGQLYLLSTSLTDVDSLAQLDSIGIHLLIINNSSLGNLTGFQGLTWIGDDLKIRDCISLSSIDFGGLLHVPGLIEIDNTGLINLSGFPNLLSIGKELLVQENDSLQNLNGLNSLSHIGGFLAIRQNNNLLEVGNLPSIHSISSSIHVGNNSSLVKLDGLGNLDSLGGGFLVSYNTSLKEIDVCNGLSQLGLNLTIESNDSLRSIDGFSSLDSIGDILTIKDCPRLETISGFDSLKGLYRLQLETLPELDTLSGFNELTNISSVFFLISTGTISHGPGLGKLKTISGGVSFNGDFSNVDFLSGLETVNGGLFIEGDYLTDLTGLGNLKTVTGTVLVYGDMLTSYQGLNKLVSAGELIIGGIQLSDISALSNLEKVNGDLRIRSTNTLANVGNFAKLDTVLGELRIYSNSNLTDLGGLDSVRFLGSLEIGKNSRLKQIPGFNNLVHVLGDINIADNDSLLDITGFLSLDSLGSSILPTQSTISARIFSNKSLTSVNTFQNVRLCNGRIFIAYNDSLEDAHIFEKVAHLTHDIEIRHNQSLKTLHGFDSLTYLKGPLTIRSNTNLESVSGFERLHVIEESIEITGDSLMMLTPFFNLQTIGDTTTIHSHLILGGSSYASSSVFPLLEIVGGAVELHSNAKHLNEFPQIRKVKYFNLTGDSIQSFSGLGNLVGLRNLEFEDLSSVTSLPDFSSLELITGNLIVSGLDSLHSLPAFPNLKYIANLRVEDNAFLEDISGLASVDSSLKGGYFGIFDNPKLQICCPLNALVVQKSVAGASMIIKNNAPGCTVKGIKGAGPCQPVSFNVSGNIFSDLDSDCINDVSESGTQQMIVLASPGNYSSITDSVGNYFFDLDTGNYLLTVFPPYAFYGSGSGGLLEVCDTVKSVEVDSIQANIVVDDWGLKLDSCPQLSTSINGMWNRRCFTQKIKIDYSNYGITDALGTKLFVKLPSTLGVVHSSPTPTDTLDNLLIYDLLTLNSGASGSVTISTQSVCSTEDPLGLESCIESWLEASNSCYPSVPGWSEVSLELVSSCLNDSLVLFSVINEGLGNMADSVSYRIFADSSLVNTGKLILASLDTFALTIPSNNQTIRIEVDQVDHHPTNAMVSAAIEGCTPLPVDQASLGFITIFSNPTPKADPSYSSDCAPFIGSFDPNDKAVTPSGLDSTGLTLLDTRLRYRIRFQNTGTDTAFLVRIVDTLDSNLDITTFNLESASHPYTVSLTGAGNPILTFTFANIQLPDSNTNEPLSHGYIMFSIDPVSGLMPQDVVENSASIYFDYNDPILTNTTLTTFTDSFPTSLDSGVISDINYGNFLPLAVDSFQIDETVFYYPVLSWFIPDDDFTDILIQRGTDSLQMLSTAMLDKSATSYTDTLSQIGVWYYYRVATVNSNGLSYSNVLPVWQGNPCLHSPDLWLDGDPSSWYPQLQWTDSCEFISSFHIYRGTDSMNLQQMLTVPDNQTTFTDSSVAKNTTYYYSVQSSNPKGVSPQSEIVSFEVGALSIDSGEFPGLSVYPNPFSDVLVIEMPTFVGEAQITLINALGESVLEERVRIQNRHSLSTHALPAGTYMLIIQDSDHQSVKHLIHLQD